MVRDIIPESRATSVGISTHDAARRVAELGDDGTNDLIVSDLIRAHEMHAWFLAEHLVDTPLVRV
jgi:starvation-inducible DNA-binding protein